MNSWPSGVSGIPTGWSVSDPIANGHDYVDLGLRIGGNKILFATMNIGASSETDYGDYFAWGETSKRYSSIDGNNLAGGTFEWSNAPYHTGYSSTTGWSKYIPTGKESYTVSGTADNKLTLDSSDDVASVLWGGNWRMPDISELDYLISSSVYCEFVGDGLRITGTGEFSSSTLLLPHSGHFLDALNRDPYVDYYLSRNVDTDLPYRARCLELESAENGKNSYRVDRFYGCSVRPVLVVPE